MCTNAKTIRRTELEAGLLRGFQEKVLDEETVDHIVSTLQREVKRKLEEDSLKLSDISHRKHQLESEIERLIKAVAGGRAVPRFLSLRFMTARRS